jgi:hypothetical protein
MFTLGSAKGPLVNVYPLRILTDFGRVGES